MALKAKQLAGGGTLPAIQDTEPLQVALFDGSGAGTQLFTAANPGIVSSEPITGTLTDASGTIASGGVSQTLLAANVTRKYLFIENVGSGTLWVNYGGVAAVQGQPSIQVPVGAAYEPAFVDTTAITIIGATTSQAFTCKWA